MNVVLAKKEMYDCMYVCIEKKGYMDRGRVFFADAKESTKRKKKKKERQTSRVKKKKNVTARARASRI